MRTHPLYLAFRNWFTAESVVDAPRSSEPAVAEARAIPRHAPTASVGIVLAGITEACTRFVQDNVRILAEYETHMVYALRTLTLHVTPANARLLQDFAQMTPSLRDRLVAACIRKAGGSALIQLDEFYGLLLLGEEPIADGDIVKVLAASNDAMHPLIFAFAGEYRICAEAPHEAAEVAAEPPAPAAAAAAAAAATEPPCQRPAAEYVGVGDTCFDTTDLYPRSDRPYNLRSNLETRLDTPPPGRRMAGETRLVAGGQSTALAVLRLRDGQREWTLPVERLPYVIGRDDDSADLNDDGFDRVSRQHLRLVEAVGNSGFRVDNLAADKNGTWCQNQPQAPRFVWAFAGDWLTLGGRRALPGCVQVRLERPGLDGSAA